MIKLEFHNTMVRKYKNASILIDKQLRERRIEHDKYIIMLEENNPFGKDEQVKILTKKIEKRKVFKCFLY